MNFIRLAFQYVLGFVARHYGFNDKLGQFCDHCGRTGYISFWSVDEVWESVAGNVNGYRHGAYCVLCFDLLAKRKGIWLHWTPTIEIGE